MYSDVLQTKKRESKIALILSKGDLDFCVRGTRKKKREKWRRTKSSQRKRVRGEVQKHTYLGLLSRFPNI